VVDELRPLERLEAEEGEPAEDGEPEEPPQPAWSPLRIAASASTIVTLLQMRRNVMKAVSWMPRISDGRGHVGSP
jgi:hypothetical protein